MAQRGVVILQYIAIDEKIANVLTNHISVMNFGYFQEELGMA